VVVSTSLIGNNFFCFQLKKYETEPLVPHPAFWGFELRNETLKTEVSLITEFIQET
jgi:hypothetical protein